MASKPHILILGAGLGGLALAQGLRKKGISYQIFERDAGLHSRFQGWAIALHDVLDDLRQSFPEDLPPIESTSHLLPLETQAEFNIYKPDKTILMHIEADQQKLPLIRSNRSRLRDYLAKNIDVQWDMHLTEIIEHDSKVTLKFSDGTTASGDLLVGADGAHSKVRDHLFPDQKVLRQSPVCLLVGETVLSKEQYEKVFKLARSAYVVIGQNTLRFFVGLNSVEYPDAQTAKMYFNCWYVDQEAEDNPHHWSRHATKQELFDRVKELTKDFDPALTEIVSQVDVDGMLKPGISFFECKLPGLPKQKRITLLGDAAHAMLPNRGEGGNHALQDALNLARAIDEPNLSTAIAAYQDEMLTRGGNARDASWAATIDDGEGTLGGWKSKTKHLD